MSKEAIEHRVVRPSRRWVVDTPTHSLWLSLVRESQLEMTSSGSSALTAAVSHDVTTVLATFDLGGQFAVKNHVDFAVRLDRLCRALKDVGGLTVWNLHASSGITQNDDVWDARGLMVCLNEVRNIANRRIARNLFWRNGGATPFGGP